jgi:predicted metal-dependent hydrolase
LNEYKGFTLLYGQWLPMVHRPSRPGSNDWLMVWRGDRVDVYPPEGIDVSTLLRAHPDTATDFPEKQLTLIEVPSEVRIRFEKEWARNLLPAEFEQVAKFLPFSWSRVFIRSQKTKWGTCSSKGNISLNWRLIKCPEFIRRYIIIHELCHTVHMNHSKAYWSLLRTHFAGVDEAHQWLKSEGELTFL